VELARPAALAACVVACSFACSGNKAARTGDDALHAPPRIDAGAPPVPADAASTQPGDLQVRVEWKAVPAVARNSPGRTPCNTPRAPSVTPTTTWGIPDAFVFVEGAPAAPAEARVVLADCALRPRVAVGQALVIESAVDRPARVTLTRQGSVADNGVFHPGEARAIQLPIAGHAVRVVLEPDGVYQLATEGADPETAWIVAAPAAVTDAAGQAMFKGLAAGAHQVTAWLPARANQPMRRTALAATVAGGELTELTVPLR
jgi:hypothetical protein